VSVEKRNLFKVEQPTAPSSGDGAIAPPRDINTGATIRYKAPTPSLAPDTTGARGGLGQSEAGAADAVAYQVAKSAYSRIQSDAGAGGFGSTIRGDSDDAFSTTGSHADGEPMTTTGGTDNFSRRTTTGIGPDTDSNITAGGRDLGA
jgi:hypothetical protein